MAEEFPKSKGGGFYELSDGTSVQGKQHAIDAQNELNIDAESEGGDEGDEGFDETKRVAELTDAVEERDKKISDLQRQLDALTSSKGKTAKTTAISTVRSDEKDFEGRRVVDENLLTGRKLAKITLFSFHVQILGKGGKRHKPHVIDGVPGATAAIREYCYLRGIKIPSNFKFRAVKIPDTGVDAGDEGYSSMSHTRHRRPEETPALRAMPEGTEPLS